MRRNIPYERSAYQVAATFALWGALACAGIGLVFLSGCATVFDGTTQPIDVATVPDGADCVLTNGVGSWKITTPGNIRVHKSKTGLTVACTKPGYVDVAQIVPAAIDLKRTPNISIGLVGSLLGSAIDASSGADHVYPGAVLLTMQKE